MTIHFISDLHLQDTRPALTGVLHRYLKGPAREADTLYILGDLFEVWIGDDGGLPEYRETIDAIADLSDHGTSVYFMRGNRDFAVGADFAAACRLTILDDPAVVPLPTGHPRGPESTRALLCHGDLLCTDDKAHQRFRSRYNNPIWRARMLRLPLWLRRLVARYARARSRAGNRRKPDEIMDVNEDAVRRLMRRYDIPLLIHGHTHRPDEHTVDMDHRPGRRIVLSDWHDGQGEVLIWEGRDFERRTLT